MWTHPTCMSVVFVACTAISQMAGRMSLASRMQLKFFAEMEMENWKTPSSSWWVRCNLYEVLTSTDPS